ncbi:hypothetical protein ACD578_04360 [Microvirga sp. RSM25]|jgi:DNA-binding CsgD family transcriptional regulator|uniref:hypothetical protein n=1 Tax=Microvirga sp. RSM25 TaxID=3273802 RepID=UPI00384D0103
MHASLHPRGNPLIRKLGSVFALTENERQVLETLRDICLDTAQDWIAQRLLIAGRYETKKLPR